MELYTKILFIALIAGFVLSIVFAIVDSSLWWLLLWPVSWIALGAAACVDFAVGNVDDMSSQGKGG